MWQENCITKSENSAFSFISQDCKTRFLQFHVGTVKPVLICHLWDKEKMVWWDRWPLKPGQCKAWHIPSPKNLTRWHWFWKSIGLQILFRTKYVPGLVKIHWRMLILECSQGCYGRMDGSATISLRNFVGEGIKRSNSYEIFYDFTRKSWPFNIGDCLIELTLWVCSTVY
jgi:hypothetical protein